MNVFSKTWFCALCYLVLIKPGCISGMPSLHILDSLVNVLRIVLILFLIAVFVRTKIKIKGDRLFEVAILLVVSIAWEVIVTYYNGNRITDWGVILNSLGIIMYSYMAIYADYKMYLKGSSYILGIYSIMNCISIILFPGGMYASSMYTENYFLGYRTSWFAIYLLALITTLLMYSNEKNKNSKKWMYIVVISVFFSMIMVWTATGLFCFTLGAFLLYYWTRKNHKTMKMTTLMGIEAAIFYASVIARLQKYASFLLVDILKKDVTLTERTRIWDNALSIIEKNTLFGIGRLSPESMRLLLGYGASHPHCRYLHIMLCCGIVGIIIFCLTLYISCKGNITEQKERENTIIMAGMASFLTACQVESLSATAAYVFPLFLIAGYIHRSVELQEDRR